MTELSADAFREVGPDDAIPDGFVVPFYLSDRSTRSTISAPAPATRARSPAACSPGR